MVLGWCWLRASQVSDLARNDNSITTPVHASEGRGALQLSRFAAA
jgi:hypothetical protein